MPTHLDYDFIQGRGFQVVRRGTLYFIDDLLRNNGILQEITDSKGEERLFIIPANTSPENNKFTLYKGRPLPLHPKHADTQVKNHDELEGAISMCHAQGNACIVIPRLSTEEEFARTLANIQYDIHVIYLKEDNRGEGV